MPLSAKKLKAVQRELRLLISELNSVSGQDPEAVLANMKMAVDLPSALTEKEFQKRVAAFNAETRERLLLLRLLYKNENPLLQVQDQTEDMKAAVRIYLEQYALSLQSKTSVPLEAAESKVAREPKREEKAETQLAHILNLKPGDLVVSEMPFVHAELADFKDFDHFCPGHVSLWTGANFDKPFAHSVREGYRPPGLKLSKLWDGRHLVFRYTENPEVAESAAQIIRNWASAEVLYTLESYVRTYPLRFWERHPTDLLNYFGVGAVDDHKQEAKDQPKSSPKAVAGPATPFGEPRASTDLSDLERDKRLAVLGREGIRRAIKFAALRELAQAAVSKKGQRCSASVVAAFQASILAPLVRAVASKQPFKQFKGKPLLEYADQVLIPEWRKTALGERLLKAAEANDFSTLFPQPFAVDQRYATPMSLYAALKAAPDFALVGRFNYYKMELVRVEKSESPRGLSQRIG